MSSEVIVYVLTAVAAVVIVLTRLRLGSSGSRPGRLHMGRRILDVHTGAGVLALVLWVAFLVADEDSALGSEAVGIIALAFWWIVAVAGLLILVRWLPSRGRHASRGRADSWYNFGLSLLAHVGMLVCVVDFTWAYLHAKV